MCDTSLAVLFDRFLADLEDSPMRNCGSAMAGDVEKSDCAESVWLDYLEDVRQWARTEDVVLSLLSSSDDSSIDIRR